MPSFASWIWASFAAFLVINVHSLTISPISTTITVPTTIPTSKPVFPDHAVDFSSALQIEASIRHEQSQLSSVPALPLPTGTKEYEAVAKLAAGPLPPVQVTSGNPDVQKIVQDILADADRKPTTKNHLNKKQSSLRIMIVGDSISHGQQGDTTWRYRFWQWLRSQNVAFQYVGPYTGTFQSTCALASGPQSPPQPPPLYSGTAAPSPSSTPTNNFNGGYATSVDSGFTSGGNSAHFSVWGRTVGADKGLIQSVLQNNPADMLLVELGFNDLGFFVSDPQGTINSMQTFIQNARAANPNIKFAIANVPQRTYIRDSLTSDITKYNQLLQQYIPQWSTSQSPIQLVDFQGNYACGTTNCPAGYDGLHPNGYGEFMIAQAFSKALIAGFGIGSTPVTIPAQGDPSTVRSIGMPTNFQVFTSPQGVSATWDAVYGAYSYNVDVSINGGGGGFSPGTSQINRWDCQWPLDGWSYSVRVQAACGNQNGAFTTAQVATAHPQLAPPPNNIKVSPTGDGFTVTFDPPTGPNTNNIVEYNIIYWDTTPSDCNFVTGAAFKSSPAQIGGLLTGKSYLVAPVTWNSNGQGLPYIAHNVVPGSGTPPVPSNLQAYSNDGTSVHLSWTGSNAAGGYEVFIRNATGGQYNSLANTSQTCLDDYFLFPGTNTYQFSVAAYNGNSESSQANGVIPPAASQSAAQQTCPPAPSWCPSFGSTPNQPYVGGCAGCGGNGCPSGSSSCPAGGSSTVVTGVTKTTTNSNGQTITTVVSSTQTVGQGTSTGSSSGSSSSSSTTVAPFPIITGGGGTCTGPGCQNGQCKSILCVVFGCIGSGCGTNGLCTRSTSCLPRGCAGPNCVNGQCKGAGCVTIGCVGPDCSGSGSNSHCTGPNCISLGCAGGDCPHNSDDMCTGPNCSEETCSGIDCLNGECTGPQCTTYETNQGGGPNAPADNPDDECGNNGSGVTMAQTCAVTCSTVSSTQTCATDCGTTTGCSVTPSTTTTTITSGQYYIPSAIADYLGGYPSDDDYLHSQAVMAMSSENSVDAQSTQTSTPPSPSPSSSPPSSPTPTSTQQPPYPTFVADGPRSPYCYSTNPAGYSSFPAASATAALNQICSTGVTLHASQTYSAAVGYGTAPRIVAAVGWAPNQSNCQPEQDTIFQGANCTTFFHDISDNCGSGNVYEGGFIASSGSNGCIEFTLGAPAGAQ